MFEFSEGERRLVVLGRRWWWRWKCPVGVEAGLRGGRAELFEDRWRDGLAERLG
jgi:hypothetical protein